VGSIPAWPASKKGDAVLTRMKVTPEGERKMGRRFSRKDKEYEVAEKPNKAKQPVKEKGDGRAIEPVKPKQPEKPKASQVKAPEKTQPRQPNRIVRWWRETIGELRKVSWPTPPEAWRLTYIVIIVMFLSAAVLGFLDFIFSQFIGLLAKV
jgi:preprotein translocase subunit SecE